MRAERSRGTRNGAMARLMNSLNPYHTTHCMSLKKSMLGPYIIQGLNEFIEPVSYDTLCTFPVS